MPHWEKKTLRLKENHGWTSEPGCQVFVADRGAVRFDLPQGWVIEPGEKGSIKFMDRPSPDDDCTLEMSIFYLNEEIDWSALPVTRLVRELAGGEKHEVLERFDVEQFERDGMTVAWNGTRFIDPAQHREAFSKLLMARKWNIQPLITYAYWADQAEAMEKVWAIVLKTLILGDYIEDPTQRVS